MRKLTSMVPQTSASEEQLLSDGAAFIKKNFGAGTFQKAADNVGITTQSNGTPTSARDLNKMGVSENSKMPTDTNHKVKLTCSQFDAPDYNGPSAEVAFVSSPLSYRLVEFDNTPNISESNTVQYEPLAAPHMPAAFQKYKGTDSITYTIDAVLTCRNSNEAFRNYIFCLNLKAWTKPFFGTKQMNADGSRGKLGAPPPILQFTGYRGMIDVPVVITKLDIPKPNDCDWINTGYNNIPFPTVLKINIGLIEVFSADQINDFDLSTFRLSGSPSSNTTSSTPNPSTSGIPDPTSIGRQPIETPNERWEYLYGAELKPWELGRPEFK
jgi:hypothetical protein